MKKTLRRAAGLLGLAVVAASQAACSSPNVAGGSDVQPYSHQQPQELFPSYSYKHVGGS